MSETEEKLLTVKEYAAENHVSRQSVNSKINRHKDELKGHVFIINGRKMLDGFAQDFLKPTKDNALLISKNAELEKSLENEKNVSKQNKSLANSQSNNTKDSIHFLPFWENGVKFFTIEGPNKEKIEFSQYL